MLARVCAAQVCVCPRVTRGHLSATCVKTKSVARVCVLSLTKLAAAVDVVPGGTYGCCRRVLPTHCSSRLSQIADKTNELQEKREKWMQLFDSIRTTRKRAAWVVNHEDGPRTRAAWYTF